MISVVVPAHNEVEVIGRTVAKLLQGAMPGELEVIVVCNACSDDTATVAKRFGPPVRVIESPIASKAEAVNTGLEEAMGDTYVVMDADVSMAIGDLRSLNEGLRVRGVMAAAPAVRMEYLPGTTAPVRAYYALWMSLPYVKEGMMAAGVWSVNRAGRERLGRLPRIISDDGYTRLQFSDSERVEVKGAVSRVLAPLTVSDLVKIKTRSRLGWYELEQRFPELLAREVKDRDYAAAFIQLLSAPSLWPAVLPYVYVNVLSRWRARRQSRNLSGYRWERDDGSRRAFAREGSGTELRKD